MRLPTTDSDPSGLFGAISGFAGAVLSLLVVLDVIDGEAADAVLAVVVTGLPILTALGIRRYAYAPATVRASERIASLVGPATAYVRNPEGDAVQVRPGTDEPIEEERP